MQLKCLHQFTKDKKKKKKRNSIAVFLNNTLLSASFHIYIRNYNVIIKCYLHVCYTSICCVI